MAYAATTGCSSTASGTLLTDEWFSDSPRGEVTDVWEKSPNSGGYYRVNAGYAANGAVSQLKASLANGTALLPTISYSLDPEGRPNAASDSAQNLLVSGVTYNPAGQPGTVTFGSGDTDTYQCDPNAYRLVNSWTNVGGDAAAAIVGGPDVERERQPATAHPGRQMPGSNLQLRA